MRTCPRCTPAIRNPGCAVFHIKCNTSLQEIVDEDLSQMHASEKALRSAGSSPTAAQALSRREGNAEKAL